MARQTVAAIGLVPTGVEVVGLATVLALAARYSWAGWATWRGRARSRPTAVRDPGATALTVFALVGFDTPLLVGLVVARGGALLRGDTAVLDVGEVAYDAESHGPDRRPEHLG